MFVKVYRYKIKRHDFRKWKKNSDAACRIYRKYGGGNSKRLFKKDGNFISVVELDYYKLKKDCLKITKQVDKDSKTDALFQEFLSYVRNKRISKEEFETV